MGNRIDFDREKLIMAVMYANDFNIEPVLSFLVQKYGEIDFKSIEYDFSFTEYYQPEMGSNLKKILISFAETISPLLLPDIKINTNEIELQNLNLNGGRKINLDPGILDLNRMILATTKNRGHRIPMHSGIYGEVTVLFERKDFQILPWTYDDFKTREFRDELIKIRNIFKNDLKKMKQLDNPAL